MIRVHHIGYLVKNITKARDKFITMGYEVEKDIVYDHIRDVDICFLEKDGYRIELVMAKSEFSVVANLIKTKKNSPYHICYFSDDFDNDLDSLENSGFVRIDDPKPAPAIQNKRVCFLMSAHIGMIELLDSPVGK